MDIQEFATLVSAMRHAQRRHERFGKDAQRKAELEQKVDLALAQLDTRQLTLFGGK